MSQFISTSAAHCEHLDVQALDWISNNKKRGFIPAFWEFKIQYCLQHGACPDTGKK